MPQSTAAMPAAAAQVGDSVAVTRISGRDTLFGTPLGKFLETHPTDSVLIAAPGADAHLALGGRVENGLPGVWCARTSEPILVQGGYLAFRRAYFFLVPPEAAPPPPTDDGTALRARYCRLGIRSVEVQVGRGYATPGGHQLDSVLAGLVDPGLPGERGGEVWRDGLTGCLDAKYGFYGPDGDTWRCVARYAIDTTIAVRSERRETGRAGELERGVHPDFLLAHAATLPLAERRLFDSLAAFAPQLTSHSPADSVPFDHAWVNGLVSFVGSVRRSPLPERAIGFGLLDHLIVLGLGGNQFGWPPGRLEEPERSEVGATGANVVFSESDFDWVYMHNYLDSAEMLHVQGEVGESLFVWAMGNMDGCGPWGGSRFAASIARSRGYLSDERSKTLRTRAWSDIATWWADSFDVAPASETPALRDSIVVALEHVLALDPPVELRTWARRGMWQARAGLAPLSPAGSCEYAD